MNKLSALLEDVKDEQSFLIFVKALIVDREPFEGQPTDDFGFAGDWGNDSISGFLEASVAWAEDSDFGVGQDSELITNKWKQFAVFLYSGKVYE